MYGEMTKSASNGVGADYSQAGLSEGHAIGARVVRSQATVPALIAQAAEIHKYAADRAMSVDGLASRALDIATRLTGSFPTPSPNRDASSTSDRADPQSALDALQRTIGEIGRPLSSMEDGFQRLAAALDAIDGALR